MMVELYYEDEDDYDYEVTEDDFRFIDDFIKKYIVNIKQMSEQELEHAIEELRTEYKHAMWIENVLMGKLLDRLDEADLDRVIRCMTKDKEKFVPYDKLLNISVPMKFGIELEMVGVRPSRMNYLYERGLMGKVMRALEIPDELVDDICGNVDFRNKNRNNKWTISKEHIKDLEISTPILTNNHKDLNEIVAMCTLMKALGAGLNYRSALQVNIGVDVLQCDAKALENVLKVWGECEELFYKISNPEGEVIRIDGGRMFDPIGNNIQGFFERDGSLNLQTDEDIDFFVFNVQAFDRVARILSYSHLISGLAGDDFFNKTHSFEERWALYKEYREIVRDNPRIDDATRFSSINFNDMAWNSDYTGRVEMRLCNGTLIPDVIFEDIYPSMMLFEVSRKNAQDPNYKKDEFSRVFKRDVTERVKLGYLLDLLMDDENEKQIYMRRWESIRDNWKYERTRSEPPTFIRDEEM